MNRNSIKYLAAAAMLIDHIAAFLLQSESILYMVFRTAGRLTAPIMCFFLAEGFRYTSSKKKYGIRLLAFAIISQIPYIIANENTILTLKFNMIFTLLLSFTILLAYENIQNSLTRTLVICILIATSIFSDWGIIAPLWILTFYILQNDEKRRLIAFSVVSVMHVILCFSAVIAASKPLYSQLWQFGVFLFIPVIHFYNNQNGGKSLFSKWFFYIFYPLHLIILDLIKNLK